MKLQLLDMLNCKGILKTKMSCLQNQDNDEFMNSQQGSKSWLINIIDDTKSSMQWAKKASLECLGVNAFDN